MTDSSHISDMSLHDTGDAIADAAFAAKRKAADVLAHTASTIEDLTEDIRSDARVRAVSRGARRAVDRGRRYFGSHDLDGMAEDVGDVVRNHPVKTILAIATVGFLLVRAFQRDH